MSPPKKRASHKRKSRKQPEPKVGIIFVVGDAILIEATCISSAEPYGDCIGHERGHEQFWENLQEQGRVDKDQDYIEVPRARATFLAHSEQYLLLLDPCILRQPKLVREIRRRLNLPARSLRILSDSHYRCSFCSTKQND